MDLYPEMRGKYQAEVRKCGFRAIFVVLEDDRGRFPKMLDSETRKTVYHMIYNVLGRRYRNNS